MGQRSQIYIRYNVNNIRKDIYDVVKDVENYKGLIARYYGLNYGERMVSRARYIIECIKEEYMRYKWCFGDKEKLEKLSRICDVNFDMKDIVMSCDIIREITDEFDGDMEYLFNQDNNNGQLFIDVTDDGIKYCFMKYYNEGKPMNAEQYMKWDCKEDWHIYMDKEIVNYTEENIKEIKKMATLMTAEELKEFVTGDYSYLFANKM